MKSIPSVGQSEWGAPLNEHLAQLNDPVTGGLNTQPLPSPSAGDEGHTYLDTSTQTLYRLDGTGMYAPVAVGGFPRAMDAAGLKRLLETNDEVFYDGNFWRRTSGDFAQVEADDTEDGFVVAIDNVDPATAAGIRQVKHVSYDMFGADNTGTNPIDQQFTAAHKVAKFFRLPVVQHTGTFLWQNTTFEVGNIPYFDLTGVTIHINENSGNAVNNGALPNTVMYTILPEDGLNYDLTPSELDDLRDNYASELKRGSANLTFPKFLEYREAMIYFRSDETEIIRANGNANVFGHDGVIVGKDGVLSTPFAKDINPADLRSVTIIPKSSHRMRIYAPRFVVLNEQVPFFRLYNIERPQTDLLNLHIEQLALPVVDASRYMVTIRRTYDNLLENAQLIAQKNVVGGNYGVNMFMVLRSRFNNITGHDGWGIMATTYCKEWTVENSNINRIDSHWSGYDTLIRNCRIKNYGILFTGGGDLTIENVTYLINDPKEDADPNTQVSDTPRSSLFTARADYGYYFDGDVIIRNVTLKVAPTSAKSEISVVEFGALNYDTGTDSYLPNSITVENVKYDLPLEKTSDQNLPFRCDIFNFTEVSTRNDANTAGRKYYVPQLLKASHVHVISPGQSWVITGIRAANFHQGNVYARQNRTVYGDWGSNSMFVFEHIYQQRPEYLTSGAGGLLQIALNPADAESHYLSDADAWIPYVYVNNCHNVVLNFTARGYVKVTNSTVGVVDTFTGSSFPDTFVHLDGSTILPLLRSETNNVFSILPNLTTNTFWHRATNHDNSTTILNLNNRTGHANYLAAGTSTSDFSNIPDGFFQTPTAQITDANGTNNTATLNAVLTALRDQGLIDR